jgi:peroxiredoxin
MKPNIATHRAEWGQIMKLFRLKPLLFALVVVVATCLALPAGAISAKKGDVAPDFELLDLGGNTVKLSDYKGKVVFLAFWASWCPRCMEELVFLQGLYTVLSDEMVVLAINQETKNNSPAHRELLKKELDELNLDFPVLLDTKLDVWTSYEIGVLPTSVILDRDGRVVYDENNYYRASPGKIRSVLQELGVGGK